MMKPQHGAMAMGSIPTEEQDAGAGAATSIGPE